MGKYIASIHRNAQSIINKKLEDYDIGSGQHDFLYVISNNEGITQKELSSLLNIGKATTAKAVKNLLKSGYIRREKDQEDKRFYRLYLTDRGKEIVPKVHATFEEMIEIYANGFSEEEYTQIIKTLKKLSENICNVKNEISCDDDR